MAKLSDDPAEKSGSLVQGRRRRRQGGEQEGLTSASSVYTRSEQDSWLV